MFEVFCRPVIHRAASNHYVLFDTSSSPTRIRTRNASVEVRCDIRFTIEPFVRT